MAPHSSTLAWKIPWMEEPGRLQSMGSLRVRHDWATSLSLSCIGKRNGNPLQCSCLENPRDGGAWWAAIYGVAQSRTRLKWLSSSRLLTWWTWVWANSGSWWWTGKPDLLQSMGSQRLGLDLSDWTDLGLLFEIFPDIFLLDAFLLDSEWIRGV